jgi:hypothetical protein
VILIVLTRFAFAYVRLPCVVGQADLRRQARRSGQDAVQTLT